MANERISGLSAVVTPASTDTFPVVQSGASSTTKETIAQLLSILSTNGTDGSGNLDIGGQITLTENSDSIWITHDGTNAHFKTNDGYFRFQTDEGTDTNTRLEIRGKGNGGTEFLMDDGTSTSYYYYQTVSNTSVTQTVGSGITLWSINPVDATTELVFNNNGIDCNFRIEGDTSPNLFTLDAGNDNITINGAGVSANYDLGLIGDGVLMLTETTTPTADTNYGKVYCKSDNKLYFQDGAGAEHEVAFV